MRTATCNLGDPGREPRYFTPHDPNFSLVMGRKDRILMKKANFRGVVVKTLRATLESYGVCTGSNMTTKVYELSSPSCHCMVGSTSP